MKVHKTVKIVFLIEGAVVVMKLTLTAFISMSTGNLTILIRCHFGGREKLILGWLSYTGEGAGQSLFSMQRAR